MRKTAVATGLLFSACLMTAHAAAQTSRAEEIEQEKAEKAASTQPDSQEMGEAIIAKIASLFTASGLRLNLGDFRPGAGLAAGLAYAAPVANRGLWDISAAWSARNFKQVESSLEVPLLPGDALHVRPLFKWNDEPDLPFFGLGNASSRKNEVTYGLTSIEGGAELQGRALSWFGFGAGIGYLAVHSREGHGSEPLIRTVFTSATAPGLGSNPSWLHSRFYAQVDTRDSPGYTTRGALYGVSFHQYTDPNGEFSLHRTEIDLRQFIPVLHNNWIVAIQGLADLSDSARGQLIPYFMLPSIGGRDTLPEFQEYRFTDKDSLLVRTELRWSASPVVDMAVLFDQGKVASQAADLNLHDLQRGWGLGARFHGSHFTAFRLELTHSFEGWRCNVAHSVSF